MYVNVSNVSEITAALKQLRNGKAPGDDGITTELLKAGGLPVQKALAKLFNAVIHRGVTPEAWSRGMTIPLDHASDDCLVPQEG